MKCGVSRKVAWVLVALPTLAACSDYGLNETSKDDLSAAHILVEPLRLDYAVSEVSSAMVQSFTITNIGNATLEIQDLSLTGSSDFSILTEWVPQSMTSGQSVDIDVALAPTGAEAIGEVVIASNDAYEPQVSVELFGNSLDVPVAICAVSQSEVAPLEIITWLGDGSYDGSGGTLVSWDWTLISAPSGSAATMPAGGANRVGFMPDLAGEYVGQLIVTNDAGMRSAPCRVDLLAAPDEDLWIEMYWTHSGDDMDLHLIAPGGRYEDGSDWTNDTDCHWRNCTWDTVNWGNQGSTDDDPSLDLDDITGTGPENINIKSPINGTYTIAVHDYPGSDYSGGNPVTVSVYLNGSLEWSNVKTISGEDSVTYFAEISWSSSAGTINPL